MTDEHDSRDAEPEDLEVTEEEADVVKGGQARRQLGDIVITKEIDKSTPS